MVDFSHTHFVACQKKCDCMYIALGGVRNHISRFAHVYHDNKHQQDAMHMLFAFIQNYSRLLCMMCQYDRLTDVAGRMIRPYFLGDPQKNYLLSV